MLIFLLICHYCSTYLTLIRRVMLKEAGGIVGGALVFSPLGMPILLHGIAGVLVGGAGVFVADAVLKQVVETVNTMVVKSESDASEERDGLDV